VPEVGAPEWGEFDAGTKVIALGMYMPWSCRGVESSKIEEFVG
jgi:hypothetical protein